MLDNCGQHHSMDRVPGSSLAPHSCASFLLVTLAPPRTPRSICETGYNVTWHRACPLALWLYRFLSSCFVSLGSHLVGQVILLSIPPAPVFLVLEIKFCVVFFLR